MVFIEGRLEISISKVEHGLGVTREAEERGRSLEMGRLRAEMPECVAVFPRKMKSLEMETGWKGKLPARDNSLVIREE